jgi:hypothetical protein
MTHPKVLLNCHICGKEFAGWYKSAKYCSTACVSTRNRQRRKITLELLQQAEREVPLGGDRNAWVLEKTGQCEASLRKAMRQFAYKWTPRVDIRKSLKTSKQEQKYAKSLGCLLCDEKDAVDACHLFPMSDGFAGWIPNIIPLCKNHHTKFDRYGLSGADVTTLVNFLRFKFTETREALDDKDKARWSETSDRGMVEAARMYRGILRKDTSEASV